jgi:CRISPR system Cascade subunit CasD
MTTLLMNFAAPMQSWGTRSRFTHRDTGREPSKSGVIGLLCAALGRPRAEPLHDLAALRLGVRVDQEGDVRRDFHTAGQGGIWKVSGGVKKDIVVSDRYYLSDARFLVGLEGDPALLEELDAALRAPAWFLFFGRKSFMPAERVWLDDGLVEAPLMDALREYRWLGSGKPPARLRVVVDDPVGSLTANDLPLSFDPPRFLPRRVSQNYIDNPAAQSEEVMG